MKRRRSKFTEEKLTEIEKATKEASIPYDYRTKDYPFEVIVSKFGEEDDEQATLYVPEYQRKYIWNGQRKSRFIESVLLGMPLTPFLLSEDEDRRLEIIDGSQRIRTLVSFYRDEFSLRGLKGLKSLNTAKFKDLPTKLQRELELRDFRVIVVTEKATKDIRADIFDRVNTSSEKLTDAEVRKGTQSGPFLDMISELKKGEDFKKVCPVSRVRGQRGEAEELLLRFFVYIDNYLSAKQKVKEFLDNYLGIMNSTHFDKVEYEESFHKMINFITRFFKNGFRKQECDTSVPRVRFEALSVGVHLALQENENLEPESMKWLDSIQFKQKTTSDASSNPGRLKDRIEFVRDCLLGDISEEDLNYE